jgi:PTS system nitrogen regulatory IIA component
MDINDIITSAQAVTDLRASDKAQLLQELARRAARALSLDTDAILGPLLDRERLGSTGVGSGIALPHAKIPGLNRPFGLFARLERPIDFASVDERPVDLVFLLLTPAKANSNDHLAALACVSRRLRQGNVADALRKAAGSDALYRTLAGVEAGSSQ